MADSSNFEQQIGAAPQLTDDQRARVNAALSAVRKMALAIGAASEALDQIDDVLVSHDDEPLMARSERYVDGLDEALTTLLSGELSGRRAARDPADQRPATLPIPLHHMRMLHIEWATARRYTRSAEWAAAVARACEFCGAAPGEMCWTTGGKLSKTPHEPRLHAEG